MTNSPTVLLLGCGYTLKRVASRLPPESVVATVSSKASLQGLEELSSSGYETRIVNLQYPETLESILSEFPSISTVVDSIPPLSGEDPTAGVRAICQAIKGRKVRVIYLSTTGVFGVNDGSEVDESTKCNPNHERAVARVSSEEFYRRTIQNVCAVRISGIYGPGRGIGISLREGRIALIEGKRFSNRIHVDDLATIISAAINYTGTLPEALCASDDSPSLMREVVEFYCKKFNFSFPSTITESEARERGMFTLLSNQRVKNTLVKDTLGIKFKYPSYLEGAGSEFV